MKRLLILCLLCAGCANLGIGASRMTSWKEDGKLITEITGPAEGKRKFDKEGNLIEESMKRKQALRIPDLNIKTDNIELD